MTTINGLPAHVLFVHAVVTLVPLTALLLVACAVWPGVLRRAGIVLPGLALVVLVAVPLATDAGEWLEDRVKETALVERHADLGEELLPWVIALFVLAVLLWAARWAAGRGLPFSRSVAAAAGRTSVRVVGIVLSLVVAVGAVVQVYRIGDSGAKATWTGRFSTSAKD